MKRIALFSLCLFALAAFSAGSLMARETPVSFFVAVDGDDSAPGTRQAPVASLERAIALAEGQAAPAEIILRGGTHFIERTVTVRRSDKNCRLVIRAAEGERAILDGSVRLERLARLEGAPGVFVFEGDFPTDEPPSIWDGKTGRHFTKLFALDSVREIDYSTVLLDSRTAAFRVTEDFSTATGDIRMGREALAAGLRVLRDNVTLKGLEFHNFFSRRGSTAVVIGGTGMVTGRGREREGTFVSGTIIDSCVARNCYFGFHVWISGRDTLITRSRLNSCVTGIWVSGIDTTIEHCEIVNEPGWHTEMVKWSSPVDRHGIRFYNHPDGAVVRHNLVSGFSAPIHSKGSPGRFVVENNTLRDGRTAVSIDAGFIVRFNIFEGYERAFYSDLKGELEALIDHNLFWGEHDLSAEITDEAVGGAPGNIFADPRFAGPGRGDYRLLPGSPALGLGGSAHAGAFGAVPPGYDGPPNLRVSLPGLEGLQSRDPWPGPGIPEFSAWITTRPEIEAELFVTGPNPAERISFSVDGGPAAERPFSPSGVFRLPAGHDLRELRFRVRDSRGAWSDEAILHVSHRPAEIRLAGEPRILANRHGALFSFEADRRATGRLEYHDGREWVLAADSGFAREGGIDPVARPGRGWEPHDYSEYLDISALPLAVTGLEPGVPHRYRLTVSTPLESTAVEGTFVLEGEPRVIYVSKTGRDIEDAGTRRSPYRTIQYALDRALPGDRVRIMPGVYFGANLLRHGGLPGHPIVIEGLYPDSVFLDGLRESEPMTFFLLDDAPHVTLRNLNFRWYEPMAIQARNCPGLRVLDCRFHNQYWRGGAGLNGRALRIVGSPGFEVRHCIFSRTRYGIELSESPDGRIENNTAVAGAVTHLLWRGAPAPGVVVRYNSFNWNGNSIMWIEQPARTLREQTVFDYNNYGASFRQPEGTPMGMDSHFGPSLPRPWPWLPTSREFISYRDRDTTDPDYEAVPRFAGNTGNMDHWMELNGQDRNSIYADPRWVNPVAGRFDLHADSPNLLPGGRYIGALGYLGPDPNIKPEIVIASPSHGQAVSGPFTFEVHASDRDGRVEEVRFYAGGRLLGRATGPAGAVTVMAGVSLPPGEHVLAARAVDDRGAETVSDEVSVTVTR